jgi:hypothetical protein
MSGYHGEGGRESRDSPGWNAANRAIIVSFLAEFAGVGALLAAAFALCLVLCELVP